MIRSVVLLALIILVVAAVLLGPQAYAFYNSQGPLPGGVTLGGMEPPGDSLEEIAANLYEIYQQPVAAYYDGERVILDPRDIDFQVDVNAMIAEAVPKGEGMGFWRPFLGEVFERPVETIDVAPRYTLDEGKLAAWFDEVAEKYDTTARPPYGVALAPGTPFTSTFMFQAGKPGLELEPNLSAPAVIEALMSPTQREVDLVLVEVPPPPPTMDELEKLLARRADAFPGLVSVFVRQVNGDEEVSIDPEIAFAGMSTMKVPIMVELFRMLDEPPGIETTKLLTETLGLSGNFTANLLLRKIGGGEIGNEWQGAEKVTRMMQELGLRNSFMATPYDQESLPRSYSTPANSRTDVTTLPDTHMQTTAKDVALLMEWIVQCSEGGGTLLAVYPDELTPEECQRMIDFIAYNDKDILLETGVPADAKLIHKHGFVEDSHGDVAAVWGPAGPYVVSLYIYKYGWVEWDLSSSIMADVSKAAWDYFTLVANGGEPPKVEALPEEPATDANVPPEG